MIQAYVGTFVIPASGTTGLQTVTGIVDANGNPFTPKGVIIFGQTDGKYTGGLLMEEWQTFGYSDGVNNFGAGVDSRWFAGIPWSGAGTTNAYSIVQLQAIYSAGWRLLGAVVGFGNGTFTYRLDQNLDGGSSSFNIFNFLAIGGDELICKVGTVSRTPGGLGPWSTTGIGFKPTGGIFAISHGGTYNDSVGQQIQFGWCDTALNQFALCSAITETANPSTGGGALLSGVSSIDNNNTTQTTRQNMIVMSWDNDGFTLNYLSGGGFGYMLFGGVTTYAGSFDQKTTDTAQLVTPAPNLNPVFMLFGSVGRVESTAWSKDQSLCIGAYDGVRQRAHWQGSIWGATDTTTGGNNGGGANWGGNNSLLLGKASGATSATLVEQGILTGTKFDGNGFHGRWTATDGVARQVIYLSLGVIIQPNIGSGLYQLVPNKLNDTIYTQFTPTVQTEDVAIPMPFADTYLAGGDQ